MHNKAINMMTSLSQYRAAAFWGSGFEDFGKFVVSILVLGHTDGKSAGLNNGSLKYHEMDLFIL